MTMNEPIPIEERIKDTQLAKHYQGYLDKLQWIEAMQLIIPDMESGLELQVRKYLDRRGKDLRLVELLKAKFYLDLMIARMLSGKQMVEVKKVQAILKEHLGN